MVAPAVRTAIEEAVERIERHLMVLQALRYIRCRRNGGSIEECLGIYRPPTPIADDPFLKELLDHLEGSEKNKLLTAVKDIKAKKP